MSLRAALLAQAAALRAQADALEALAEAETDRRPEFVNGHQAQELGLMRRRVFLDAAAAGDFPSFKHGREVRARTRDVINYLDQQQRAAQQSTKPAKPSPTATTPEPMDPIEAALASGRFRIMQGGG